MRVLGREGGSTGLSGSVAELRTEQLADHEDDEESDEERRNVDDRHDWVLSGGRGLTIHPVEKTLSSVWKIVDEATSP